MRNVPSPRCHALTEEEWDLKHTHTQTEAVTVTENKGKMWGNTLTGGQCQIGLSSMSSTVFLISLTRHFPFLPVSLLSQFSQSLPPVTSAIKPCLFIYITKCNTNHTVCPNPSYFQLRFHLWPILPPFLCPLLCKCHNKVLCVAPNAGVRLTPRFSPPGQGTQNPVDNESRHFMHIKPICKECN